MNATASRERGGSAVEISRVIVALTGKRMNQTYDVLVVGGGIAGLTAAAYCAKAGLQTLVCERGQKTGGLVNSFSSRGYYV
jgi:ribulose 1,5-bisphosphate synthetase/thiazole synthase